MAFEQDINDLVAANDRVTNLVSGKLSAYDTRVAQAESKIDSYTNTADVYVPFYRLTKNDALTVTSGSIPDHWHSSNAFTYTLVQSVETAKAWDDRTEEERDLLRAMSREGTFYIYRNFNIWRMDWTAGEDDGGLYQKANSIVPTTVGAMTKLLSGSIEGNWAEGATNEWKLTGRHIPPSSWNYHYIVPSRTSDTGSMLFALPAAIAGHVRLDASYWGTFPYIGDQQYD